MMRTWISALTAVPKNPEKRLRFCVCGSYSPSINRVKLKSNVELECVSRIVPRNCRHPDATNKLTVSFVDNT
jgi:hypothetical protein